MNLLDNLIAVQFSDSIKNIATAAKGFKIEIAEATMVHGPTTLKTLIPTHCSISTQLKPDDTLTLTLNESFSNASGSIRIIYDSTLGGIYGTGGIVESFDMTFIPVGLDSRLAPHQQEYLEIGVATQAAVVPILPASASSSAERFEVVTSTRAEVVPIIGAEINKPAREQFITKISTACTVTDLTNSIP